MSRGPGNDRLIGGPGRDRLNGGPGNDRIDARRNGIDTITCGPGRDTVIADHYDRIARNCENVRLPAQPPPAPTPPPPVGTRGNPVPVGTAAALSDRWRLTVLSVTPNATAQVLAENQFNDPPAPGFQFFIATVQATYTGPGSDDFDGGYRLRALGQSSVSYTTFDDNSCGVLPNDLDLSSTEAFKGGTISGNVCWAVKSSDAGALVMFDDALFGEDSDRVWFTLTPPAPPPPSGGPYPAPAPEPDELQAEIVWLEQLSAWLGDFSETGEAFIRALEEEFSYESLEPSLLVMGTCLFVLEKDVGPPPTEQFQPIWDDLVAMCRHWEAAADHLVDALDSFDPADFDAATREIEQATRRVVKATAKLDGIK